MVSRLWNSRTAPCARRSINTISFAVTSLLLLAALPLTLSAQVNITEFPISAAGSAPAGITVGPDGAIWFAESGTGSASAIGRISVTGAVTQFPAPSGSQPLQIVAAGDGNLYFTVTQGNFIGQLTPSGTLTEFAIPTASASPFGIALGSDGALWFTEIVGTRLAG